MPWLREFLLSVVNGGQNSLEKPVMARVVDSLPNGEVLLISDGEYSVYTYLNKEAASTLTSATLQGEKLSLFSISILKCHFTTSVLSKDGVERVILHIIKVDRLLIKDDSVQATPQDVFFSVEIPNGIRVRTFPYCLCNRKRVPSLIVMCINNFESNISKHQYGILRTDAGNKIVDYLPPVVKATKKATPRSPAISKMKPSESFSSGYNLRSSANKQSNNSITLVKKPKKIAKKIESTKEKKERKAKMARSEEITTTSSERAENITQLSSIQQQQANGQNDVVRLNSTMIGTARYERIEKKVDGEIVIDAIYEHDEFPNSVEDEERMNGDEGNQGNQLVDSKSNRKRGESAWNTRNDRSTLMEKGGEGNTVDQVSYLNNPNEKKDKQFTCEENQVNTYRRENTPKDKKLSDKPASTAGKEESAEDIIKMISLQNNDIEFESSSDSEQEQEQIPSEPPSYIKPLYKALGIQNSSIDMWSVRWRM